MCTCSLYDFKLAVTSTRLYQDALSKHRCKPKSHKSYMHMHKRDVPTRTYNDCEIAPTYCQLEISQSVSEEHSKPKIWPPDKGLELSCD